MISLTIIRLRPSDPDLTPEDGECGRPGVADSDNQSASYTKPRIPGHPEPIWPHALGSTWADLACRATVRKLPAESESGGHDAGNSSGPASVPPRGRRARRSFAVFH